jgi:GNAT superfamily N-acetyltransferase
VACRPVTGRGSIPGMSGVTIRPAVAGDYACLGGMFTRAELGGETMAGQLAFVERRLGGAAFVADADGELVGASAAVTFGTSGWIGGVAVLPGWRRAGLGRALTAAAVRWLDDAGTATVSLHATALGRPVYERLGFVADGRWLRLRTAAMRAMPTPPAVRTGRPADLDAVLVLDRAATGSDRSRLLRAVWGSGCLVAEDAGGLVRGFHVPKTPSPAGRHRWTPADQPGATIAVDAQAGAALLAAWQRPGVAASVVLPAANVAGRGALQALGYLVTSSTVLMRRGPVPARLPERIFGGFNLFWG